MSLRQEIAQEAGLLVERWREVRRLPASPEREESLQNLAAYVALRRRDLRDLQRSLAYFGLSSLGRSEIRVLANLDTLAATLSLLVGRSEPPRPSLERFESGARILANNSEALFGAPPAGRSVRIMVTLPEEAASSCELVQRLLVAGMDCARINCGHDDTRTWARMVKNLRRASRETGRPVRLCMDMSGPRARIERVELARKHDRITQDAHLFLSAGKLRWHKGVDAVVTTGLAAALPQLAIGAEVCFDGGRLSARVVDLEEGGVLLKVVHAPPRGMRLKPDQGLNFPGTDLDLPALTDADTEALRFIAEHADLVGYSFVQSASAVADLQRRIRLLGRSLESLGLILKIETALAVRNLPSILASALGEQPMGVMIARGDLAVELGFERLAELQEEVLWLCEAARVPVIWATQVLERLTKKGSPTRAEITDAAAGQRAECVMLNKGPFVVEALGTLDHVLRRMQGHQAKKTPLLQAISW